MRKAISHRMAAAFICLLMCAGSAAAYDNDTHFWLTYYLARKVGYTHIQAMQIASANISVDLDKDTQPVTPRLRALEISDYPEIHGKVRYNFHALPRKEEANKITGEPVLWWDPNREEREDVRQRMTELVNERKNDFWRKTLTDKRNPGMFVHFLQDSFAHRDFKSYIGHGGYSRIDFLASDRGKTADMVNESLRYLIAFREVFEGRSTVESMLNPSVIDPATYMSAGDLEEVASTVKVFVDENPSEGAVTNGVTKAWDKLSLRSKKFRRVPAPTLAYALGMTGLTNPAPDSRKAREAVRRIFSMDDEGLPVIWVYNYDRAGFAFPIATQAVTYKPSDKRDKDGVFTSIDEEKSFESATAGKPVTHPCPFNLINPSKPEAVCVK